ncbi:hypothetical protein M747DRAFT_324995 [Aspergillus niger ATCC 13496]|uniref:Contig An04c0240, genomic contig n=3 Tax=Aspergillus niger TaxID=5061 RepID=A2QJN6_ASPNC|nr:uncharacterized protein An04g07700 [Aspergillus niger]RDH17159.1 hypothetical protein M747DRAFT_324995 [Aspergillus niger ATCC 13496]CAK44751.1 unnamed protein product [Aspergillus niger]
MTLSVGHRPRDPDILVMEAWGQGFLVGSLVVMIAITAANMKKGMLLHKLIVAEGPLVDLHHLLSPVHHPAWVWMFADAADPHQPTVRRHAPIHGDLRCVCGGGHLAFVFKCLSDTIILDDFRSALDRLRYHYHPDGVPPQEATHARGRSTNRLVDCVPEASIKRPEPFGKIRESIVCGCVQTVGTYGRPLPPALGLTSLSHCLVGSYS